MEKRIMNWIKYTKRLHQKLEILHMAATLNMPPEQVIGHFMRFADWVDDNATVTESVTDVTLPALHDRVLDSIAGVTGFAEAMRSCGWLRGDGREMVLQNWGRHNGQTAKQRALTSNRVQRHRVACNTPSVTDVTQSVTPAPLPEKRREEKNTEGEPPHAIPIEETGQQPVPTGTLATNAPPFGPCYATLRISSPDIPEDFAHMVYADWIGKGCQPRFPDYCRKRWTKTEGHEWRAGMHSEQVRAKELARVTGKGPQKPQETQADLSRFTLRELNAAAAKGTLDAKEAALKVPFHWGLIPEAERPALARELKHLSPMILEAA
jgi:hypothetical protein